MSQEERITTIISLMRKLNMDEPITRNTKFKGTTIENLCKFEGGGYHRVKNWLQSKVDELKDQPSLPEEETTSDLLAPIYKQCFDVMDGRNKKYGDSWRVLSIQSIANLVEMKMHRIANMSHQELDPKIEDEFIDAVNYAVMGLQKLNEKNDKD